MAEPFLAALVERARATGIGPLVDRRHRDQVHTAPLDTPARRAMSETVGRFTGTSMPAPLAEG